jgi:DNA-binding NtrC family response regulator
MAESVALEEGRKGSSRFPDEPRTLGLGPERQGKAEMRRDLSFLPYAQAKREALRRFQRRYASALLRQTEGNVTAAAKLAGIPRQTLHRILRDLGSAP